MEIYNMSVNTHVMLLISSSQSDHDVQCSIIQKIPGHSVQYLGHIPGYGVR
jgi:hypothetical protein